MTHSDILDRFKERKVGLTVESRFDPTRIKRAEVVLQQLLAERGRQYATIAVETKVIPPSSVALTFNIDEGPKVKIGRIGFEGNQVLSRRQLVRSMKNSRPYGIPYTLLLESLFSKTYDKNKLDEDTEFVRGAYQDKGYQIIYLTARPYWVTADGREWFGKQNLPAWHYRSNPYGDGPIPPDSVAHKSNYVRYLRDTVGLNIIRAYGNASSDIEAYANGGMPKTNTWIIGEHAGKSGTQALNGDYALHYSSVVQDTPLAACKR